MRIYVEERVPLVISGQLATRGIYYQEFLRDLCTNIVFSQVVSREII